MGKRGPKPGKWRMTDFFKRYAHCIDIRGPKECWPWTGSRSSTGYGTIHKRPKTLLAHHCAYESAHGDGARVGRVIRHSCDNPPCVNPSHLLVGTQADNYQDMVDRGRRVIGSEKFTASVVRQVKGALAAGRTTQKQIAERFGMSEATVSNIKSGKARANV